MGAEIPHVVRRYIFGHLLGREQIVLPGEFSDFELAAEAHGADLLIPEKGLHQQLSETQRELTICLETLSEIYFACPGCGTGAHCHPEDRYYVEYLQGHEFELRTEADNLRRQIETLQRLADPELMGQVYDELERARLDAQQITLFVAAARATDCGYSEFREIRKEAAKLIRAVAATARMLARLIQKLQQTGVRLPPEVRQCSHDDRSISPGTSRSRLQLLRLIEDISESIDKRSEASKPVELRRIRLDTAKSLQDWPVDFGSREIEAAISTRQNSKKSSQVRAFGAQLRAARVTLNAGMYRAIAITMCVVADDSEASISEDDVRKALKRIVTAGPPKRTNSENAAPRKTRASDTP